MSLSYCLLVYRNIKHEINNYARQGLILIRAQYKCYAHYNKSSEGWSHTTVYTVVIGYFVCE